MSSRENTSELPQMSRLREIVARLRAPNGCPWDREQTHMSLRSSALEEAYEVVEAIDTGDDRHLKEELGDLLLQVVMHAQIAGETGRFDFEKVAEVVADKLVRRHPHVFGDTQIGNSDGVVKQWEEIKRAEREELGASTNASVLDGVSKALPSLMRAEKMQKRAARAGFDWQDLKPVLAKIKEEIVEVEDEIASGNREKLEDEIGDLLFTVVNLTRKARFEAEILLNQATEKFMRRFHALEGVATREGRNLNEMSLEEMDVIWEQVKAEAARSARGGQGEGKVG